MGPKNRRPPMPTPTRDAPLLDIDTVAQALGVTRRHVQRLVSERRIPFIKVGRFVRFDPASLNMWLDCQRVEPERGTPREYAPGDSLVGTPGGLEPVVRAPSAFASQLEL